MKRNIVVLSVLLAALASCSKGPVTPSTPGLLVGTVVDSTNSVPLAGAKVVVGTADSTLTGADGKFSFSLLQGRYTIQVSKNGYYGVAANVPVISDDTTRITIYTLLRPWTPGTAMASGQERHNFASVFWGGLLHLVGGRRAEGPLDLNSTLTYSPAAGTWQYDVTSTLTPGRQLSACAVSLNTPYLFGGLSGFDVLSTVLRLSGNTWVVTDNPMPAGLYGAAAAALGDSIFIMGGFTAGGAPTNLVRVYRPSADTVGGSPWSLGPSLQFLGGMSSAVIGNTIYVFGGTNGTSTTSATYSLDAATDTAWTSRANMPAERAYAACAAIGNDIYVFGGLAGAAVCNSTYRYNPAANAWTVMEPMPLARYGAGAVANNNRIHVIGGCDGTNSLGLVEIYNPAADAK